MMSSYDLTDPDFSGVLAGFGDGLTGKRNATRTVPRNHKSQREHAKSSMGQVITDDAFKDAYNSGYNTGKFLREHHK